MRTLISLFLRQRFVVLGVALVFLTLALRSLQGASFEAFPEFAPPRVEIQTEAEGLSSQEVEQLVTAPLEAELGGTPGLVELRSKSVLGLSSVLLVFERGVDLLQVRTLVTERVARTALPAVARRPVVLSPLSSTSRVLKIGVWSDTLSQMELSDLVRWTVRPKLMSIPGVANVAIWGERRRQLQIETTPERLNALGVSYDALSAAVQGAVTPLAGGLVDTPNQRVPVIHSMLAATPEQLAELPIPGVRGGLTVGDVARVLEAPAQPIGEGMATGLDGLLLIVEKQPGANTLAVTRGVEKTLKLLGPAMPNVQVDSTIFRPAGFIERAIQNLTTALGIGTLLVVLVLFIFLWDFRTALISLVAIPCSLIAAAGTLSLLGMTFDTMVIAGFIIALGEVVDDAIIDVENIHRRLGESPRDLTLAQKTRVVLEGALEVRSAVVYATIIIALVFLPVLFLPGVAGTFFRPMAIGYGLAVLASLLVAVVLTPVLSLLLLRSGASERHKSPAERWLRPHYELLISSALRRPRTTIVALALVTVGSSGAFFSLRQTFLPDFAENDFLMHWIGKPGTSLAAMKRSAALARKDLLAIPGVRNFGAHIGRAEVADEVVGPQFGELWISVDPTSDLDATMAEVQRVVDGYPGIYRDVQTYLQERMREVLSGGSTAVVVRVFGSDWEKLGAVSRELAEKLDGVSGVRHASPPSEVLVPQLEVSVDVARCAALGVDPGQVRARVRDLVQGRTIGTVMRQQQPLDVVVRGPEELRSQLTSLPEMLIDLGGQSYRLRQLAELAIVPMSNTITHHAGGRKMDIGIELEKNADLSKVSDQVRKQITEFQFPLGFHAETLGENVARAESQNRLLWASLAALVGVFLVLLADFQRWIPAALVMGTLPFALLGGGVATLFSGGVVSLGTLVGLITVVGIAARNSILLLSNYRRIAARGGGLSNEDIVAGAGERLSPILMTALSTGLALIPIVVSGSRAGHEIEHPLAVVVLGGILTATLMTLVALPLSVALMVRFRGAAWLLSADEETASQQQAQQVD